MSVCCRWAARREGAMLGKINDYGVDGELRGITASRPRRSGTARTLSEEVVRFPGVRINRDEFLRQELTKLRASEIERALAAVALAGVRFAGARHPRLNETITYETTVSRTHVAGLPGGFAMLRHDPRGPDAVHARSADHAEALLYGWRGLPSPTWTGEEMIGVLAVFFGVMLGVGGAAQSLKKSAFARIAASRLSST